MNSILKNNYESDCLSEEKSQRRNVRTQGKDEKITGR
jgi:hypothetical protein